MRRSVLCLLSSILYLLSSVLSGCALLGRAAGPPETALEDVKRQIHRKVESTLSAGFAKVEITPRVGTPLAGYSKRRGRPTQGIRDPLYVRTLVLSDGEDRIVLVSADLLVFPYPMAESIVEKMSEELKIPRQSIFLTTTHTHSGTGGIAPGFLHERVFGPYRPQIVEGITGRILWSVRQAMEHLEPVRWGLSERETGLLDGLIENRAAPSGPIDPSLQLLLFSSMEGKPVGVLINAAAHPTLADSQDLRFSADFPGEVTRGVEAAYPGVVCLFVNGAAGDLRPRDSIGSTPDERIGRFGQALAEAATGMINELGQKSLESKGDLAAWGWWIELPLPQIYLGKIPIHPEIGRLMRPNFLYLSLAALDGVLFVPLSAEMTTDLGRELKGKLSSGGNRPILLGYSNGYLGYAVTPQQYPTRTYEAWMTWYGPQFGVTLIEQIRLLAALYPSERKE